MPTTPRRIAVLLAVPLLAALAPRLAHAGWPRGAAENLPVYTTTTVSRHSVVSDGAGGMYVVWQVDDSYPYAHVMVSHVRQDGQFQCQDVAVTPSGLALQLLDACTDDHGGAIVVWQRDTTLYDHRVYAQRVGPSGSLAWAGAGVRVFPEQNSQSPYAVVPDHRGGALVVGWVNTSLRVQRVRLDGVAMFGAGGVTVVPPGSGNTMLAACSDDSAGVVLAYYESHSGGSWTGDAVRVHHFDGAGNRYWAAAGVTARDTAGTGRKLAIAFEKGVGAWVAWADGRFGLDRAYVQRVRDDGTPMFGPSGLALDATEMRGPPALLRDPAAGARLVWPARDTGADHLRSEWVSTLGAAGPSTVLRGPANVDLNAPQLVPGPAGSLLCVYGRLPASGGTTDLYALRMTLAGGVVQWGDPTPVAVCTAPDEQLLHRVCTDGDGGLLTAWQDRRAGVMGVAALYAQRVTRAGVPGDYWPLIAYVNDVKPDQGGQLAIGWYASGLDGPPSPEIGSYRLWRLVLDPPATWELVLTATAAGNGSFYGALITSPADSMAGLPALQAFKVEALAPGGAVLYTSPPDTGYSVDNLAPAMPTAFAGTYAGGTATLGWAANGEADLAGYRLYRGVTAGFVCDAGSLVAEMTGTSHVDVAGAPFFYRLTAVDRHGNQGPSVLLLPEGALAVGEDAPPRELTFALASPNPARGGGAAWRIALPRPARVTLTLIDAQGRRVRTLLDAAHPAGTHAARWDGRDAGGRPVPGGLYFALLETAGERRVTRLVVLP